MGNIIISVFVVMSILFNAGVVFATEGLKKGVWVTCFTSEKVLYSSQTVHNFIQFCRGAGIDEVYLQLYRAGEAYYDSKIISRSHYERILQNAGMDTLDFLLNEAQKNKIKIFAWINVLSLAQNKNADIISRFGDSILTRDQHLRTSIRSDDVFKTDRYYLRDTQLFLEPGDPRVVEYILRIIEEIVTRYPGLSGVHLDYIRYPYIVPLVPGSRFNDYGLTYGYGERNIERFKRNSGLDPLTMQHDIDNFIRWDNWKREQVTELVRDISRRVKNISPYMLVSCAVLPSPETAYSVAYQDWPTWLKEGIVDYVILMDYTKDNLLFVERIKSGLSHRGKGEIYIGIGAFLLRDNPNIFFSQYRAVEDLGPDGAVFFSYDDRELIERLHSK